MCLSFPLALGLGRVGGHATVAANAHQACARSPDVDKGHARQQSLTAGPHLRSLPSVVGAVRGEACRRP